MLGTTGIHYATENNCRDRNTITVPASLTEIRRVGFNTYGNTTIRTLPSGFYVEEYAIKNNISVETY